MNDLKYLLNIKKLLILKTLFCIFTFSVVRIKSATAVISDAANKVLEAFGVVIIADGKSVDVIGVDGIGVGGIVVSGIGVFDVIGVGVVFDVIGVGVVKSRK
jgi:hypothetical protein